MSREGTWDPATALEAMALAQVGMWEWSAATGEVRWSDELCRIYGFDPATYEHDFSRFMATVIPEDRALVDAAISAALTSGEPCDFELRIVTEAGERRTLHAVGKVAFDDRGRPERILGATQDITARRRAEEALGASERRFRPAFEDAPIGMALVALDGTFLRVNRAVAEILGRPPEELLGQDFQSLTHPDDLEADLAELHTLLAGEADQYEMEKRYLRPDGSVVWSSLSVSLVRDPSGEPDYFVSQIQDVSQERMLRDHLHHLAAHDGLTGLRNRRCFDEDLAMHAARARRYGERAVVVLLDLNGFKQVNDTLGHHAGDDVLRRVAEAIRSRIRAGDLAARVGGDEFAVLLGDLDGAAAEEVAGEIAAAIAAAAGITAAFGTAALDRYPTPDGAMRAADAAMYEAKLATRSAAS